MNYEYTDGYVGSFGRSYKPVTAENQDSLVSQAAEFNQITEADVIEKLKTQPVRFGQSANFYYDHSYAEIRPVSAPQAPPASKCSECGTPTSKSCLMDGMCPDCWHDETDE